MRIFLKLHIVQLLECNYKHKGRTWKRVRKNNMSADSSNVNFYISDNFFHTINGKSYVNITNWVKGHIDKIFFSGFSLAPVSAEKTGRLTHVPNKCSWDGGSIIWSQKSAFCMVIVTFANKRNNKLTLV